MTDQNLKPCPFCGGEGVPLSGSGAGKVGCVECFSEAHVDTWNRRLNSWISVEERLPEPYVRVWTYPPAPFGSERHMKYDGNDLVWFFDAFPVTHWQPLPEPPIEGD